ncbi:MAG: hypothetical protein NUV56_02460 [Candidatus Uhrbacteria bacterium]|nr:hypothetical protein [Candidatus Uhrbacteria bacterium]
MLFFIVSLLVSESLAAPRQPTKAEATGAEAAAPPVITQVPLPPVVPEEATEQDLASIYKDARKLEAEYRRGNDTQKLAKAAGMYAAVANERREVLVDYRRAVELLFKVNADLASGVVREAWRRSDKNDDFKPMVEQVLGRLTKDARSFGFEDITKRLAIGGPYPTGDCSQIAQKVKGISELSSELGDFNTWKARRLQYADVLSWCSIDGAAEGLEEVWGIYNEFGEGENARKNAELLGNRVLARFQAKPWAITDLKAAYDWYKRAQYDGKRLSENIAPIGGKAEEAEQYAAAFAVYYLFRDESNRKRMELLVGEQDQRAIMALLVDTPTN